MHSVIRRLRRGVASSAGLLIVLTVFGVLLMHSVTPTTSMADPMSTSMSGRHASMAAAVRCREFGSGGVREA
ncbi:MAG: hypothetical protein OXC29_14620 [Rhodococcus sp.]|uniref:hypothetical protein n=1 Tax=Rhodococcus qingshengii TaxID=334542 RepID=UPI00207BA740|nr:hypothetical protein [Rhodococcus qingshengii]MCY4669203.1 hypothetical protein [Rhodococcus sp. (in: high G+C Gram-positive bacteria)]